MAVLKFSHVKALQDAVQEELLLAQGQAEQERAAAQAQQQVIFCSKECTFVLTHGLRRATTRLLLRSAQSGDLCERTFVTPRCIARRRGEADASWVEESDFLCP